MITKKTDNEREQFHKKSEVLISIIIPVYNVEPFIDQCMTSVLQCDLHDSEIILSLGDSTDNSLVKCKYYQEKNHNIILIHQQRKGLSDARNSAMKIARGRYIVFIDSDDYIIPDIFNKYICDLRTGVLDADLIVSDFFRLERTDGYLLSFFQIGEETPIRYGMEFLPQMLKKRECFWNVWRFIFRRRFLEQNSLLFMENYLSEDIDFITSVIIKNPSTIFIHRPYYIYAVGRDGSLMKNKNYHFLHDTVHVLKNSISLMRQSGLSYAGAVIAQYQYEYILSLAIPSELPYVEQEKAFDMFNDYKSVLNPSQDKVVTAALSYINLFGLQNTSHLLHFLKVFRRKYRIINKKVRKT